MVPRCAWLSDSLCGPEMNWTFQSVPAFAQWQQRAAPADPCDPEIRRINKINDEVEISLKSLFFCKRNFNFHLSIKHFQFKTNFSLCGALIPVQSVETFRVQNEVFQETHQPEDLEQPKPPNQEMQRQKNFIFLFCFISAPCLPPPTTSNLKHGAASGTLHHHQEGQSKYQVHIPKKPITRPFRIKVFVQPQQCSKQDTRKYVQ